MTAQPVSDRVEFDAAVYRFTDQLPASVYLADPTDVASIVFHGSQLEGYLGYSHDEWESTPEFWLTIVHPDDRERIVRQTEDATRTGEPLNLEYRSFAKDGSVVWIRDDATLIHDDDGTPLYWQGVVTDITEQKRAEIAFKRSAELFGSAFERAAVAMSIGTVEGRLLRVNRSYCEFLGYDADDLIGMDAPSLIHPDDLEEAVKSHAAVVAGDAPFVRVEQRFLRKDGSVAWGLANIAVARDENGDALHVLAQIQDISEQKRANEELQRAEARYRTLIEHIDAATYVYAEMEPQRTLYMSPQIESISGYAAECWERDPRFGFTIVHPDDVQRVTTEMATAPFGETPIAVEYRYLRPDGTAVWIRNSIRRIQDHCGHGYLQGLIVDISELKRNETALRQSEARYAAIARNFPGGAILLFDHELRFVVADGAALETINLQRLDVIGRTLPEVVDEQGLAMLEPRCRAALDGDSTMFELQVRERDFLVHIVPVRDDTEGVIFGMVMAVDITDRRALEHQLSHQALHDAVTGLPNRALLADRTDRALAQSRRSNAAIAVLFLDIDNFKVVNDTFGHSEGDRLLVDLGRRLQICVRDSDTVARFGGDEFAVLLPVIDRAEDAVDVAKRIERALAVPFSVGGRDIVVSGSIGIATSAHAVSTSDELLRQADIAMYRAKAQGKHQSALFDAEMHVSMLDRLDLEADLRAAIERDQLRLEFQPTYAIGSGALVGVEALVRWQHPTRGLIPPDSFIKIAEETGVIVPLGAWVLRAACAQARAWLNDHIGNRPFTLSVNLSGKQFADSQLVHQVAAVLASQSLPEGLLTLELTESVVMADAEQAVERLRQLKHLGVSVSIDDFGTGYSSLAYLKRFPVDILKIDRSFIAGLGLEQEDSAIVEATIMLARALGLRVVAEGVETACQLDRLSQLGCDWAQGYFFSKPVPASEISKLLQHSIYG